MAFGSGRSRRIFSEFEVPSLRVYCLLGKGGDIEGFSIFRKDGGSSIKMGPIVCGATGFQPLLQSCLIEIPSDRAGIAVDLFESGFNEVNWMNQFSVLSTNDFSLMKFLGERESPWPESESLFRLKSLWGRASG
jgi:hypothetical protein